ncbi:hypothetical protein HAX54_036813 [Datura stramonium]|uniref:Uncharacterized protein n=1 Tax=Datura stramonium TaxID=4076 RepID=A0ABS8RMF0_DATST|nr:hypothetical protein [Datura stramonium]
MVKPSTPYESSSGLKLSFFDQGAPRMYVPILFHYLPTSEGSIAERCDKLQKSLSQTLTKFYPLAGRFSEDEFTIHCNDEGVEYLETKVNADLAVFPSCKDPTILSSKAEPIRVPHSRDLLSGGRPVVNMEEHALGNFYVTVVATLEAKQRKELNDFVNVVGSTTRDISANIDFGWGKPSWVSSVSKNYEGISLIDTKSGDGIEAWIGLKEKDMADFERDPDILSFTSKAAFDSSGNCFGTYIA